MREKLLASGGVLAGLAASTCCIVPLALATLGVGGAWIGGLTALAPYQPIFIAVAAACLGAGFWLVYRRREPACDRDACALSAGGRLIRNVLWVKGALWLGAVLASLSLGLDLGARLFV
jgi:mercuric ion transport protein